MAKNKVLITGADGFIGSHLTEEMVRKGYEVKAFTLYNSFNSWGWLDHCSADVKNNFEVFMGDIRDPNGVREAMKDCKGVLHLAALIAIPYSYHSPDTYLDTNIRGTLNVLQAARDGGVEKIIQTSTSEVYGSAQYVPINETHPLKGQSPYSATKIAADQMAYSFYASFGTPVTIVRPFNTYGPRQSARAIIPSIITQIVSGKSQLKLGSMAPTRDFNYVEDTVAGFLAAFNADDVMGETINIGSNYEISILETVEIIQNLMQSKLQIISDEDRLRPVLSEVDRLWCDNAKAKELLNWEPKYSGKAGLESGLKKTIEWFCSPENMKQYKPEIYAI